MTDIKNDGDKVWVTVSNTINLGNYNSVKIEMGYNKTIPEEDSGLNHINSMCAALEDELKHQSVLYKKKFKRKKRIE